MAALLLIILSIITQLFLPWWSISIAAAIVGYTMLRKRLQAFLTGFFSIFLVWTVYALIINAQNSGILAARIAEMMSVPSPILLPLISGILGGITGGVSTWAGRCLKDLSEPNR